MPTTPSIRSAARIRPWPCSVQLIFYIGQVITNHNLSHHLYADDTQVYISLSQSNAQESVSTLSDCLSDILIWMESYKIKLNPDETDLIFIGTKQQRNSVINHFPIKLLGSDTFPSDAVCYLGVVFDSELNFRMHITQVYVNSVSIIYVISVEFGITYLYLLVKQLISSRLDYCNSLLNNIAKRDLAKLQRVKNFQARVVFRSPRFLPSLPLLNSYTAWLPVSYRIHFKLSTLTYRAVSTQQPPYLASLLHLSNIRRQLRSSISQLIYCA